jgi:hypothetical protein
MHNEKGARDALKLHIMTIWRRQLFESCANKRNAKMGRATDISEKSTHLPDVGDIVHAQHGVRGDLAEESKLVSH